MKEEGEFFLGHPREKFIIIAVLWFWDFLFNLFIDTDYQDAITVTLLFGIVMVLDFIVNYFTNRRQW